MHTPRISHDELSRDIDESLDSLGLDALDFYWLHRDNPPPDMPIGEIIELMEGFVPRRKDTLLRRLELFGRPRFRGNALRG